MLVIVGAFRLTSNQYKLMSQQKKNKFTMLNMKYFKMYRKISLQSTVKWDIEKWCSNKLLFMYFEYKQQTNGIHIYSTVYIKWTNIHMNEILHMEKWKTVKVITVQILYRKCKGIFGRRRFLLHFKTSSSSVTNVKKKKKIISLSFVRLSLKNKKNTSMRYH